MAVKRRPFIKFQCSVCKNINYSPHKSKKLEGKLEFKKFCKHCKKHTLHKETKK